MKNENNPLVSIVIPLFNSEKYISETIQSVLIQTYDNWELIIVDDCSTDSSKEIVKSYASKNKKITLLELEKNFGGPAKPRNVGMSHAKGDLIAFLDADDVWTEDKVQTQIDFFAAYPDTDILHCQANIINETSQVKGVLKNQRMKKVFSKFIDEKNIIFYSNFININSVMMRYDSSAQFTEDKKMIALEDWMFFITAFNQGKNIHMIDKKLLNYRVHSSSISMRASDSSYRKAFYMYSILLTDFKIPLKHFMFASILNMCKLFKRRIHATV